MRGRAGRNHALGFSVIELLVATAVTIVFAIAGWSFQRTQAEELTQQSASLEATEKIRSAMDFMIREIRRAGYDPRLTALIVPGTKGISEARSDRLRIQWDRSENGAIETTAADPNAEDIVYSYDSPNQRILRTVDGVSEPLVRNVTSFQLDYFDVLGNAVQMTGDELLNAVKRDLIAFVRIVLRVQSVGTARAETLKLASRVTVRQRVLDRL